MTPSQTRAIDGYRAVDRIVTVDTPNPNGTVNFTVRNDNGKRTIFYQVGKRGGVTCMGHHTAA